ncbi:beta-galactosidase [Ktedonobacter sp. SOSP1-52]|nr:glycoside hydrolase family 2 TIM barrel-domain containing protein [Ktedonobacter sp. SOSP1-52]GHO64115.1 beta-galactosidase [Ktedonobacter sp. SOSP1-52]
MIRILFNDGWEYAEGGTVFGMLLTPTQPVTLPHDASIERPRKADHPSRAGGAYAWNGVLTYRKRFLTPPDWQGQCIQLEFEGVMGYTEVTLNGHLLVLHPYGYTSFLVDLTPYLHDATENELLVTVNNSAQPNSRWYTGTGIYRHVWLLQGGALHIPAWGVFVTTPQVDSTRSIVAVETAITNTTGASAMAVLRSTITDPVGEIVAQGEIAVATRANDMATAHQQLAITDAQLWSVETPHLYSLSSEVVLDGTVIDRATTTFGIRSLTVDPIDGFRLNGVPLKLKGGCVHHDHGPLGAASYDHAEERKVALMKAAGFNALRSAHNPPAPALLDACDRLGMLVIDESFDMWRIGKTTNDYHLYFEQWWQRDTEAMVQRDRNHPSVIMWSIGNEIGESTRESDSAAWSQRQSDFVRMLDPTRPVLQALPILFAEIMMQATTQGPEQAYALIVNPPAPTSDTDRWGPLTEAFAAPLDVVGYNYMPHRYDYDQQRFPSRVICGTESFPHQAFAVWEATVRSPHVIGDFVWVAVDYLGESGIGQVAIDQSLTGLEAPYPYHLANCGDFDICGVKRPQSYYRDILWGVRTVPYIAVLAPQHVGKTIQFGPWGWEPVIVSWSFPARKASAPEWMSTPATTKWNCSSTIRQWAVSPPGPPSKIRPVLRLRTIRERWRRLGTKMGRRLSGSCW